MQISMLHVDARHPVLDQLIQLCLYDLSGLHDHDIGKNGRFADGELDAFPHGTGQHAYLIEHNQLPIGFMLVGRTSRVHQTFQGYSAAGIFVLRRYRRLGCARAAALQVLAEHPGVWEVATASVNVPAIAFWRNVAHTFTDGDYSEAWYEDGLWRGPVQTFVSPEPPS